MRENQALTKGQVWILLYPPGRSLFILSDSTLSFLTLSSCSSCLSCASSTDSRRRANPWTSLALPPWPPKISYPRESFQITGDKCAFLIALVDIVHAWEGMPQPQPSVTCDSPKEESHFLSGRNLDSTSPPHHQHCSRIQGFLTLLTVSNVPQQTGERPCLDSPHSQHRLLKTIFLPVPSNLFIRHYNCHNYPLKSLSK